jgi:iron complex outermembrane receptor protein
LAACATTLSVASALLLTPLDARAQSTQSQTTQPAATFQLPTLIVTAQKEPADAQTLPLSLTAIPQTTLANAGVQIVSEAGAYGPNLHFTEFTARKLSNARFRGVGGSPANPSVTTHYDGVPQLNANTASLDFLDVEQAEFVRGPQGTLFGRNTLGGLINVTSIRPSLADWSGTFSVPFANNASRDVRGSINGPLADGKMGVSMAMHYGRRDGYTVNDLTGNDLDSRSGFAAKGQFLWTPTSAWETRVIVNGERDRDGDYALSDLGGLRQNPFHTARDFEGHTYRDVFGTTIVNRHEGQQIAVSSTTGFVKWDTEDATDLDYSPLPLLTRSNNEESFQFTQEVRLSSAAKAPVQLGGDARLTWQTGVFLFTQNYDQNAVNTLGPIFTFLPFDVANTSPLAALDDFGVGVYGQGTATLATRLDLTAGVRVDYEQKDASLSTFYTPALPFFPPQRDVVADESYANVSPQFAAAFHVQPGKTIYAAVANGYRAGGFNPASPAGSEAYGEEHTWSVEGGVKTAWAGDRVTANASVFWIDWNDLQTNVPNPQSPGEFYIVNIGGAASSGVEVEVNARVRPGVDVFGSVGYTHARFDEGSTSSGAPVGGNIIPNTPDYTGTIGVQLSHDVRQGVSVYGRAEGIFSGAFMYDDFNLEGQDAYSLANFRGGLRTRWVFVEAWIRNAFDTRYIPTAFAYGQLAPSGFIGEMGNPRTFGVSAGVGF